MNYMKELNAFRDWLVMNSLPTSAVALWYALMSLNNLARWKKYFNAPSKSVCQQTGLSESGALKARKVLLEHGLIECIYGKRDEAPIFRMISLIDKAGGILKEEKESTGESTVNLSVNSTVTPSCDIHKPRQDETKTNRSLPAFKNQKPFQPNSKQSMAIFDELLKEVGS